jgi:hypothetical protein
MWPRLEIYWAGDVAQAVCACFVSAKPQVQTPVPSKTKRKKEENKAFKRL